jgi:hypothetical protein
MQWEESSVNTPIKCQFLKAFFAREKRFFLTGGSALGLFYLDHRLSYDLDFFTVEEVPEYVQKPLTLDELRVFLEELTKRMAAMAYPE